MGTWESLRPKSLYSDMGTNIDYDWWEQSQPWHGPPKFKNRFFDRGGVHKYSAGSQQRLGAGIPNTNIR